MNPPNSNESTPFQRKNSSSSPFPVDLILITIAVIVAILAYQNTLRGDFVYDDLKQILENQLIRDNNLFWKALSSDVWAFNGERATAWSNYWRPTFTFWHILHERLFGLDFSLPWHLTNILLHAGAVALVFKFLRFLKFDSWASGAISLLFAVHPVHVESVAWISGVPDLLVTIPFLGALWIGMAEEGRENKLKLAAGLIIFSIALLAKEIAIIFPVVLFLMVLFRDYDAGKPISDQMAKAFERTEPYLIAAFVYFMARFLVLGTVEKDNVSDIGILELILTLPSVFTFYLRQSVFPAELSPNYSYRAVTPTNVGFENFWGPILICLFAAGVFFWVFRQGKFFRYGLVLFILPLAPALNIGAFHPEQLVHDRYLYLPILGFLILVYSGLNLLVEKLVKDRRIPSGVATAGICLIICVPLTLQTVGYNRVWLNSINLWSRAVEVDPDSAFSWSQLGIFQFEAGDTENAKKSLNKSLEMAPVMNSYLVRADIAFEEGRLQDAVEDINLILQAQPKNFLAFERLAIIYQRAGDYETAIEVLETARRNVPYRACGFTSNLGVVYYLLGDKEQALIELSKIPELSETEYSFNCRNGLFHLGNLYFEFGRMTEAKFALENYLQLTASQNDLFTIQLQNEAIDILNQLE